MKYDFDKVINRRIPDCVKWNVGENEIPMWVADMDFEAAPEILKVLRDRVSHGVFGYTDVTDEWYDAYINRWDKYHGLKMDKAGLMFCTGVVPAISSVVRKLTSPNENVLIQTPVYNVFFNSIVNNGCRVLESPLVYDGEAYSMDLSDLEKKLSDPQTSLMILCNPQNPTGNIWDAETLAKIGELCKKHHVAVISDEIHCDITEPGSGYIPFASVSDTCREISVNCIAPTKAFNLAGLQTAAIYVPDPYLCHKVRRAINTDEVAEPNAFAVQGAIAAFNECSDWLDEMRGYVFENRKIAEDFIKENIPEVKAVHGKATYLMWIDVSEYGNGRKVSEKLRKDTGLFVLPGDIYGRFGEGFIRMNVACPRSLLKDGLERLRRGILNI